MDRTDLLLGMVGLTTRQHLEDGNAKKKRWHALVRDVFAQYYMKFRESSLEHLPALPQRYTPGWEATMKGDLQDFRKLDLESIADMLNACGFGTDKWQQMKETGFPALSRLIDEHLDSGEDETREDGNGRISAGVIDAAVDEDLRYLTSEHSEIFAEFARRFDPESGVLTPTEEELRGSETFRDLTEELDSARLQLRRFHVGGRRALNRIRNFERQVDELEGRLTARVPGAEDLGNGDVAEEDVDGFSADAGNGVNPSEAAEEVARLSREIEQFTSELADRDDTISGLAHQLREAEPRPDDVEGRDELMARIRQLEGDLESPSPHPVEEPGEELETAGPDDDPALAELRQRAESAGELARQVEELQRDLAARAHTIEVLREELETEGDDAEARAGEQARSAEELAEELQGLQNDLKAREHTIGGLRGELEKTQAQLESAARRDSGADDAEAGAEPSDAGDGGRLAREKAFLAEQNEQLQRDLSARNQLVDSLRSQLHRFEEELGDARDQLVAEVQKLAALAAGDLQVKPSQELEGMEAEQLLSYARDVAEDLDVRRQTLSEGLQGIDTIKDSFEENKKAHEVQQEEMSEQLQNLRAELDAFEREQAQSEQREADGIETDDAETSETIQKQREQLQLLSTRIRQLASSNQELGLANKKTTEDMASAVRKIVPLRSQITNLQNLTESMERYIRQKHDRTFTMRRLKD